MVGVGAAFDFHAGSVPRAPAWMRDHGLEWLHRLASEPRRLWRRYLVTNTAFVLGAARQLLGAAVSPAKPLP
jgi:N-acetylglucosaminyldiphosphoundecaprenol N-acetyl-beta-D-mannosaminyltransferase